MHSVVLFQGNNIKVLLNVFRIYLVHDLQVLVAHIDPPLQQNLHLISMYLENQLDQQLIMQLYIHQSKLVAEDLITHITNQELLSEEEKEKKIIVRN